MYRATFLLSRQPPPPLSFLAWRLSCERDGMELDGAECYARILSCMSGANARCTIIIALPPLPPTSPVPSRKRSLPAVPPISPRASRRTSSSESTICSNVSATLESPRTPGRSCYHPFNKSSRFVEDLDESEEQESEGLEEYVVVGSGGQSISNTNKLRKRYP